MVFRLTRPQRRFLAALEASPSGSRSHHDMGRPASSMPHRLERQRLLEILYEEQRPVRYRITDAGRRALVTR